MIKSNARLMISIDEGRIKILNFLYPDVPGLDIMRSFTCYLDPRLAKRLQQVWRLSRPPRTLDDFIDLFRESDRFQRYRETVKAGRAIGETTASRGQSIVYPDGREASVMCGFDSMVTALLMGEGTVRASCMHCGERMDMMISDSQLVEASSPSILWWFGDGPRGVHICDHTNFFPDLNHLASWLEANPEELGVPIPLDNAVEFITKMVTIEK